MKNLIITLVAVFLICSPSFSQTILFQDDFEDGNADNWQLGPGWSIKFDEGNYVLNFDDIGGDSPIRAYPLKNIHMVSDFELTMQIKYHSLFFTVISFRQKHSSSYHFSIDHSSGQSYIILSKDTRSGPVELVRLIKVFNLDQWYAIKITMVSSTIKIYIDDIQLIEYTDNESVIFGGSFSFACENESVSFDNIMVTSEGPFEQEASWFRTGGPLGGIGYDVRVDPTDPNIIYVTDQWAGCHKSYDGGKTWYPKNNGINSRFGPTGDSIPIFCLTIDPNDPNTIWCGTFGMRGVYKSTDKAEYWQLKVNGIPNTERLTFRSFAIEPGNSDIVYCGTEWVLLDDEIPAGQRSASKGKIYKTIDGGENWTEILFSKALVRTIIIDPTNTDVIYAATGIFDRDDVQEEGIWKSTDAGSTWFHINNGITNLTVGDIEMHPNNPNILLAVAGRLNGFGGGLFAERGEILRSVDGGMTWSISYRAQVEQLPNGQYVGKPFTYVEFDESNSDIVYAAASDRGFFKSTDGGVNFFETTYNPPYVQPGHIISIATHKDKSNWLITNSYGGGVFISEDGTYSWRDASKGYTGCEVADIAVAPNDPLKIYAVARSSVFMSDDGGNNWHGVGAMYTAYNHVPIGPLEMRSIAIHPNNSNIIVSTDQEHKIFKTINGGKNWRIIFELPSHEIKTIVFSPSNPDVLYAGATVSGGYQIDRPFPFDPTRPSYGMLKSTDTGENWYYINNGLESTYKNINHIAVHPNNPDIVYIGTLNSGVYKTTNGGNTWFKSSEGIFVPDVRAIAIDPSNPNIVYAGAQRGGIYKTLDGGQSWQPINYGMDPEAAIRSIVIDPTNPVTVYAGDWLSGVYRTTDGGQTWYHINKGLRTRTVQKLAISKGGKYLYAGTQGEGVFRLVFDQIPPEIQSIHPDTAQTIQITQGDSLEFSATAFDPNGDVIQYQWYLDGALLQGVVASEFLLKSDTLAIGDYQLSVSIADSFSSVDVLWQVQIIFPTSVELEEVDILRDYQLFQNYPNPFNPATTIKFAVKTPSKVVLNIYDILGCKVQTLIDKKYSPGFYQAVFDASDLASGLYLYEIKMGEFREVKKALFLK